MPNIKKMHETDKDQQHEEFISGRHQEIPVDPAKEFHRTTLAAGAVIWRGSPQEPEIALIHRPHYDDWSLPKGKVDPGETPEAALIRELDEELGIETWNSCLAPLTFASHSYDDFHLLMPVFACRRWQGVPQPREGQQLAWVRAAELTRYPMPPADLPLIPILRDWL